jgi:hypothetical protein
MSIIEIKGCDHLRRLLIKYKIEKKPVIIICHGNISLVCLVDKVNPINEIVKLVVLERNSKFTLSPPYYLYFKEELIFTKLENCQFLAKSIQFKFTGKYFQKNIQVDSLKGLSCLKNEIKFISQDLKIKEIVSIKNGIVSAIIHDSDNIVSQIGLYITNVIMQYGSKEMLVNFKIEKITLESFGYKKLELRIVKIDENDLRFITSVDKINDKITA